MARSSSTQIWVPGSLKEDGEKRLDVKKKRKYKSPPMKKPKVESEDECDHLEEKGEPQTLSLHSTQADGSKSKRKAFIDSDSEDDVPDIPSKKTRFPVTTKPSSSPHKNIQHRRDLPKRLVKFKAAIESLSDDWDVITRAPEVTMIDSLHESLNQRDGIIWQLRKDIATIDALHKTVKEKNTTISQLKEQNARLKQDFAQQVDEVQAFEEVKSFMRSTLGLEASGTK
ncbi:hypothetical protein SBOR_8897 [Sclerotinia borealis F-4128]|uniref:Uncharacterized protein n=1 Tax=Sclerotinia borealis (strain F-4128) TaxID=1432307 RepID=W9C4Q3_SCLBF|nr:hypothetical protein SBOR_8897 [Sclerotinia borealis F-4128]